MTDEQSTIDDDYEEIIKQLIEGVYESIDTAHITIMSAERDHPERGYAELGSLIATKNNFLDDLEEDYERFKELSEEVKQEREEDFDDEQDVLNESDTSDEIFG